MLTARQRDNFRRRFNRLRRDVAAVPLEAFVGEPEELLWLLTELGRRLEVVKVKAVEVSQVEVSQVPGVVATPRSR